MSQQFELSEGMATLQQIADAVNEMADEAENGGGSAGAELALYFTTTVKNPPLSGSGYCGYPPGMVPGIRKRGITRRWILF